MSNKITRQEFLKALLLTVPALGSLPWLGASDNENDQRVELRSDTMRVTIVAGTGGVWLDQLALKRTGDRVDAEFAKSEFTNNLLQASGSGSAFLPVDMPWQAAHLGPSGKVTCDHSSAHISGILIGPDTAPSAREEWTLTVRDDVLQWNITREFLRAVTLRADRFPCLAMTTEAEIASFLDPTAQIQSPRLFLLEESGDYAGGEMVSPRRVQWLEFSPSGLVVDSQMTTGFFSFVKTTNGGTTKSIVIGSETVDRGGPPVQRQAGMRQQQRWTLRRRANATIVPFQLTLPDGDLTAQTRSFAHVHNQWMGWVVGNNPASVSAMTEIAVLARIQGVYAAEPVSMQAFDQYLEFVAAAGVEPNGFVNAYWQPFGFHSPTLFGNFHEPVPQFILAIYEQAINTGDRAFVQRIMPILDRVASYMLAMDKDNDGIFEDPNSGLADGSPHVDNWYDIINFGHKDGITNAHAVAALHAMAELKVFLGDASSAQPFRAAYERSKAAYNKIFWDDEMGIYMDWIDVHEKMPASGRRYFYTENNMLAIIHGIANSTQAQRILSNLDARYEALCQQFHRQRDDLWATPANMYPITQLGDMVQNGELIHQKAYPMYENGGAFFYATGLEIAARGAAGQAEQAYATFERLMRRGYARNRLWGAELLWNTDTVFSEPLNSALLILWGFAYGCLGIRKSLTDVQAVGISTLQLEGATHTFRHSGKNVTVRVCSGRPTLT